jgi:hypothetical protein
MVHLSTVLYDNLSFAKYTSPEFGEPLNVIISGLSDPYVLTESGFHDYAKYLDFCYLRSVGFKWARHRSIGFSEECFGLHYGHQHTADLGDGDGRKLQQYLARQHYFPVWGTCWESLAGVCQLTFLSLPLLTK